MLPIGDDMQAQLDAIEAQVRETEGKLIDATKALEALRDRDRDLAEHFVELINKAAPKGTAVLIGRRAYWVENYQVRSIEWNPPATRKTPKPKP